jgi:ribosomal protein S18 acetylase RimI-like enzyme
MGCLIPERAKQEAVDMEHLDNPVWWAIRGPQRALGSSTERAARFDPEMSPFGALAEAPTDTHWDDLGRLVGAGQVVALTGDNGTPPSGWTVLREMAGVQMVGDRLRSVGTGSTHTATVDPVVTLGSEDVDDMLDLVVRARPGPFLPRTVEFGGYVGVRREGRLIAMAGERLRLPGLTEISAVATDPDHRNQGLAERLVRTVAAAITGRDAIPFLHADTTNAGAIRLYRSIGFTERRPVTFTVIRSPDQS